MGSLNVRLMPHAEPVSDPSGNRMSRFRIFIVAALSGGTCLACLFLLSQLDFQAVLFIRSFHGPLVERLGNIGHRLGHGVTFIILSAGLWGVGRLLRRQAYQRAGRDAFVAYILSGIAARLLKYLIGRPRPRFAHQEAFDYGPSLQVGLDAFPSGHTAVSCAVAAVLARAFPAWAWAWYGGALFVGVSRFVRGSHFPTDVLVGAVVGFLIGYVWARPLAEWRRHAARAWMCVLPFVVGGCAMFWTIFSRPVDSPVSRSMFWAGLALCAGGVIAQWRMAWRGDVPARSATGPLPRRHAPRPMYATSAILLGLAISLHTGWIVAATLMACVVWWMMYHDDHDDHPAPVASTRARDICLTGLWVIVVAVVHGLRGLVPLR